MCHQKTFAVIDIRIYGCSDTLKQLTGSQEKKSDGPVLKEVMTEDSFEVIVQKQNVFLYKRAEKKRLRLGVQMPH